MFKSLFGQPHASSKILLILRKGDWILRKQTPLLMGTNCSDPGLLCHMGIQIHSCLIMITLVLKRGKNLRFLPRASEFQNIASIRKKKSQNKK